MALSDRLRRFGVMSAPPSDPALNPRFEAQPGGSYVSRALLDEMEAEDLAMERRKPLLAGVAPGGGIRGFRLNPMTGRFGPANEIDPPATQAMNAELAMQARQPKPQLDPRVAPMPQGSAADNLVPETNPTDYVGRVAVRPTRPTFADTVRGMIGLGKPSAGESFVDSGGEMYDTRSEAAGGNERIRRRRMEEDPNMVAAQADKAHGEAAQTAAEAAKQKAEAEMYAVRNPMTKPPDVGEVPAEVKVASDTLAGLRKEKAVAIRALGDALTPEQIAAVQEQIKAYDDVIAKWEKRVADFSLGGGDIPTVKTDEEVDKLPPGTEFIYSDGKKYRKN